MHAQAPSPVRELDVRPTIHAGREPFQEIMDAVDALAPGESLRLLAPFRPVPLFAVMSNRGFGWKDRALANGDWEVVFSPLAEAPEAEVLAAGSSPGAGFWPDPSRSLDLVDLPPPEPMVEILAALEAMDPGEVLFAVLAREPLFLFPELAKRGHEWAGNFDATGTTYRILVRRAG